MINSWLVGCWFIDCIEMFLRQYLSVKQKTEDIFVALTDKHANPSSVITIMIYLASKCAQTCTYKKSNTEEPSGEQQKVVR